MTFDPRVFEGKKDRIVREKRILTSLILDTNFCKQYVDGASGVFLAPELFSQSFARKIAQWCFEYYVNFNTAIGKDIEDIFQQSEVSLDEGEFSFIGEFLQYLAVDFQRQSNEEFDENPAYLHSLVVALVNERSVELIGDQIGLAIRSGNHDRAKILMQDFCSGKAFTYNSAIGSGFINLMDEEVLKRNQKSKSNNVICTLEGKFGEFIGALRRKSVTSFMGIEKSGKSFILNHLMSEIAKQNVYINNQIQEDAMMTGSDVSRRPISVLCIHIELDDYTSTMRFHQTLLEDALENIDNGHVSVPFWDCAHSQYGTCQHESRTSFIPLYEIDEKTGKYMYSRGNAGSYKPCTFCFDNPDQALGDVGKSFVPTAHNMFVPKNKLPEKEALKKLKNANMRFQNPNVHSYVLENFTATPEKVSNVIREYEMKFNRTPDILIIDYWDIVTVREGKTDTLEEVNEKWKYVAQLAKRKNMALITVEQSNRDGRTSLSLESSNTADNKNKDSHMSSKFAISATPYEEERNMFRLHSLLQRHRKNNPTSQLLCLKSVQTGSFIRNCIEIQVDEWSSAHAGMTQHLAYNNKRGFQPQKNKKS